MRFKRPYKSAINILNAFRFALCVAHGVRALVESAPDVVVGTGGQVSAPACVAAAALGIPVLLYEANAKAGEANQRLHFLARRTLLAYDSAAADFRFTDRQGASKRAGGSAWCLLVGPAVRHEVVGTAPPGRPLAREQLRRRSQTRTALRLPTRGSRLLVVLGGSQGSTYLNCAIHNALPQLATLPGLHVLWQTGNRQHHAYSRGYASTLPNVHCVPFIPDVGSALAAADLVLSRAGAASVAELAAARAPCVLVPSPAVNEARQAANARLLADQGLAVVVPQMEVDDIGIAPRLLGLLLADCPKPQQQQPRQKQGNTNNNDLAQQAPPKPQGRDEGGKGGGSGGPAGSPDAAPDASPPVPAPPPAVLAALRGGERRVPDAERCRTNLGRITAAILEAVGS
ncbi:hypothetical protein GPECTOR_8g189 [Gonium pectorale]|uniref:Glycosyl transferase family 28 C-terminal domain-containing protein n=1 Tax=Gonium pectorale TaxID=33097 RepID=A0A150GSW0_GONPE|nr:hypothetical protein GPECTOR_8g189 [Gonium pectorale]|eukprot:KXZ52802.1 hypothetical protein GPECTOR_8g189 [Gonium pectorale]